MTRKVNFGTEQREIDLPASSYRIESKLEELARFPVYEPAGRSANCYYDYKIKKPKDGGLLFLITVHIEDATRDAQDAEWLPIEKERTMLII